MLIDHRSVEPFCSLPQSWQVGYSYTHHVPHSAQHFIFSRIFYSHFRYRIYGGRRKHTSCRFCHDYFEFHGRHPVLQIYLKKLSEKTGSHIYGKAEFQNPGGSVKDRAALGLIQDAEEKGLYVFSLQLSGHL